MGELPERVAVLGAGRSGKAAARALAERGHRVLLSELKEIREEQKHELEALGIALEEGGHSARVLEHELIVISPGVPPDLPLLQEARARGIPIWGELELGYRLLREKFERIERRIIAVTGTNGKSTTVELIGRLLRTAGVEALVAGNVGEPLCALLDRVGEETVLVLEVSSFQLETIVEFHPHVAVFTNFAPDHLDRHGTLARYFATKCRIFLNQDGNDFAVVQRELFPRLPRLRARTLLFSAEDHGVRQLALPRHLREDVAAALRAARLFAPEISPEALDPGWLRLSHRLEFVAEVGGVRFYDDSKATNVAAALAALGTFAEPVTVILGGRSKGEGFTTLAQRLKERGDFALLIGEAGPEIAAALDRLGYREYRFVADLDEAVARALELEHKNKICLLAPACASFDMFSDYAARGRAFQEAVKKLIRGSARRSH